MAEEKISIYGAREHNLKNINISLPRNKLIVFTGISGSGKSSLAFDTIYAEGQRRYMESFSAYARSFIGDMERSDVDKIDGLNPVISIEQKTTSRNPRSTVGTVTEIYDFFRLLYARAGEAYSYLSGNKMVCQSEERIIDLILKDYEGKKIVLLAPVVKGRKGHYRELFVQTRKSGFTKVRVDGEIQDLIPKMQLDRYKTHDIEIVIDRLVPQQKDEGRLKQSVQTALKQGDGMVMVQTEDGQFFHFSENLMDAETGLSYDAPAPNNFSFNSPYGACQECRGLGLIEQISRSSIIPDESLSIAQGGIAPLGKFRDIWIFKKIGALLKRNNCSSSTPIKDISEKVMNLLLFGDGVPVTVQSIKYLGTDWNIKFDGIIRWLEKQKETGTAKIQKWVKDFTDSALCPTCEGKRLKKESLHFKIAEKDIGEIANYDLQSLQDWLDGIESKLSKVQLIIATEILKEIRKRLGFILDVGLGYLSMNRSIQTLSGGEAQRIRLATQIGTQLVNVLYILDEPSIGLHQRDNMKLIQSLRDLRDLGNTVIVVEHDKDMMLASDYIVDIGPGAGRHGGQIVAASAPKEFIKNETPTSNYLNGRKKIAIPTKRRGGNGHQLTLTGASGHNLKSVNLILPLGKMICVTGVSGSGKSTLIHETLYPSFKKYLYKSRIESLPFKKIEGMEHIDKVIEVDQSPIGRTPRSNPATYTHAFSEIRTLYAEIPESKIRGYKPGRFSFNVPGGRCETCRGSGLRVIGMDFLPDVSVSCETCKGHRYNRETLEVRFRGKSIADVLDMTVELAVEFFENHPRIVRKIKTLNDVGLGYVLLGQHATTLSGGEAQRMKLAAELAKQDTGKTFYILDEPTTGLHFQDISHLLIVLNKLVDKGNTVLVIEHNMDVIKVADYLVDLGPEGGDAGGQIIATGTPEEVAQVEESDTARFLKEELNGVSKQE